MIAASFADIFRSNALANGFVPVELDARLVEDLIEAVRMDPSTEIVVDVDRRTVAAGTIAGSFALDDYARTRLLEGLDDIALTLRHDAAIAAYEAKRPEWLPRVR